MTDEGKPFDGLKPIIRAPQPSGLDLVALVRDLEPFQRQALMGMSVPAQIAVANAAHQIEQAAVHFRQSAGQIVEALTQRGVSTITYKGLPDLEVIRGREIDAVWHDEMEGTDMLDETAPPPLVTPTDPAGPPPSALSNNVTHRDFHPSYLRVGVRIDGMERNDIRWYDVAAGLASTTGGVMLKSEAIEPYWRYPESRQMRRARERWEGKRK